MSSVSDSKPGVDFIEVLRSKAKARQKTIVLPEYDDKRVVEAVKIIEKEKIAKPILLTPDKINIDDKERYAQEFFHMRQEKGMDIDTARKTMDNLLYYAAMMVWEGKADGFVAGANHTTSDVARAAIHCIGIDGRLTIASSCFLMAVPDCSYGKNGAFIFADCGIIPEPNARQLACIAIAASELANKVLGIIPRAALLSYSTKGSAKGRCIDKIVEALGIVKNMAPDLLVDGEMQVDAAIVPEVAKIKYPNSPLGGKANVLIFPNLEAGNISYKLVQRLANARAIGPLFLGLNKPGSDLSRGCFAEDVVDSVAITAIRAQ